MKKRIQELKDRMASLGISDDEDFGHVPQRLGKIRRELLKKTNDKVFEAQNLSEVLGMSATTYSKFENNKMGTSFRVIIRAIYFFSTFGYNPLWILTKDNLLIPKELGGSDYVLNRSTVDHAYNELVKQVKMSAESTDTALERFKERITS